jgi:hypothetical protein
MSSLKALELGSFRNSKSGRAALLSSWERSLFQFCFVVHFPLCEAIFVLLVAAFETARPHRYRNRANDAAPQADFGRAHPRSAVDLARCFLRLTNLPNFALDRLGRYEGALWRQVGQTLFALDALRGREAKRDIGR